MNTLSRSSAFPSLLVGGAAFLRRSRSLASMLPALLWSGLATLYVTALMHLPAFGANAGFLRLWMESWLTAWPLTFPIVYIVGSLLLKLVASLTKSGTADMSGLCFNDAAEASDRVTARRGLVVTRHLKPNDDFRA